MSNHSISCIVTPYIWQKPEVQTLFKHRKYNIQTTNFCPDFCPDQWEGQLNRHFYVRMIIRVKPNFSKNFTIFVRIIPGRIRSKPKFCPDPYKGSVGIFRGPDASACSAIYCLQLYRHVFNLVFASPSPKKNLPTTRRLYVRPQSTWPRGLQM